MTINALSRGFLAALLAVAILATAGYCGQAKASPQQEVEKVAQDGLNECLGGCQWASDSASCDYTCKASFDKHNSNWRGIVDAIKKGDRNKFNNSLSNIAMNFSNPRGGQITDSVTGTNMRRERFNVYANKLEIIWRKYNKPK